MKRSESVVKIASALLKAQRLMGGATKGAANPYFKSKYADYGSVLEACKDLLNDNGVVILQPHVSENGKSYVETTLLHESGESLSSLTEIVCAKQNDPQALGSAITYARRYGLQSLLAMPAEDDDGERAMIREPKQQTKPYAAPTLATVSNAVSVTAAVSVSNGKATNAAPVNNSVPVTPTAEAPKKSSFKSQATKAPVVLKEETKPALAVELGW